jgi:antirestriction protein
MDTVHTGDRTTGCNTCAKNDYLAEIIEQNRWTYCIDTMQEALEAWVANSPTYYKWENHEEWVSEFEDAYQGAWASRQEFADHLADETITGDLPEVAQIYFDYQKFCRDLFLGDYWESNGYVFRNN